MKFFILSMCLVYGFGFSFSASAAILVKGIEVQGRVTVTSLLPDSRFVAPGEKKMLRSLPRFVGEFEKVSPEKYVEFLISEKDVDQWKKFQTFEAQELSFNEADAEVRVLLQQGPWENRINFTIVGDGYTLSEKEKFFSDAQRTANDLFVKQTFQSYLPLFNISAVFVPSKKSGIGDGSPIETAFKLYRTPKGSKRAIMPGDEYSLDRALSLAPATTYPIVLGNDEYYGGLGGKYSISTSSEQSGLIVLRHELGHSIGEVGEEYDNGSAYFGANSANSLSTITWKHWIQGPLKGNEAARLSGDYVWKNLKDGDYISQFSNQVFPDGFFYGEISSVGWATGEDVQATLDGAILPLLGVFSRDRNFYSVGPLRLAKGNHQLRISEKIKDGDNVLGFAQMWAVPADYDFTPNKVDAFATLPEGSRKTYRPTHKSCAMRDMLNEKFCVVDQENLWLKMLDKISLIDSLVPATDVSGGVQVKLETVDLPHLQVHWFQKISGRYEEVAKSENLRELILPKGTVLKVTVDFQTPEVLLKDSALHAEKEIRL